MAENPDDVLHVEGGKPLNGTIKVRGAKNFVSKAMVAALLAPGKSVLKNVPEIRDVHVVSDLLRLHGVDVDVDGANGIVTIDASRVQLADVADVDTLSGSSRIPILFSGPLVHRLGEAFIPALGGCAIGGRPIDFHLETLRKLGATVDKEHKDGIHITAPNGLHGAKIHLPYPSVGATEQTLLAAVLAEGKTELSGAATEPEIMDLVCVLQKMGAIISVDVDRTFRIEGVKELQGYTHTSLTDRIEAASWASAALATHGDIFVKGATQPEMITFLNVFRKVGGKFEVTDKGIRFWHPGGDLKPVAIETDVHPGFMTDWQQPLVGGLAQTQGPDACARDRVREPLWLYQAAGRDGCHHPVVPRVLGLAALPFPAAQLQAFRRDLRTDPADRTRHRRAGPAWWVQPSDRGLGRVRPLGRARHQPDRPRLCRLPRQTRSPRCRLRLIRPFLGSPL